MLLCYVFSTVKWEMERENQMMKTLKVVGMFFLLFAMHLTMDIDVKCGVYTCMYELKQKHVKDTNGGWIRGFILFVFKSYLIKTSIHYPHSESGF